VRCDLRACPARRSARHDRRAGLAPGHLHDADGDGDGNSGEKPAAGAEPEQAKEWARPPAAVTVLPGKHGTRLY
jgi:hypothetical protein